MENFSLVKVEWSKHRERLKPFIDAIGDKANDPKFYTNINKACSNERAFLFLAFDGFIVLRPRQQNKLTYVEIAAGYFTGGNAATRYQKQIISLARMGSASYIEFLTIRKGAGHVAKKLGWKYSGNHEHLTVWRYHL